MRLFALRRNWQKKSKTLIKCFIFQFRNKEKTERNESSVNTLNDFGKYPLDLSPTLIKAKQTPKTLEKYNFCC